MTEDEAKTKVCPAKLAGDNRFDHKCEASSCMAWRWKQGADTTRSKIEAIRDYRAKHNSSLGVAKDAVEATWVEAGVSGFCGLAGAPQ